MLKPDTLLTPGQKVMIERIVTYTFEVDIKAYLEDSGETDISVIDLEDDILNNFTIEDVSSEFDNVDISEEDVKIVGIV